MPYMFIIERPDGSTYEQLSADILVLLDVLGEDYQVVDIYDPMED